MHRRAIVTAMKESIISQYAKKKNEQEAEEARKEGREAEVGLPDSLPEYLDKDPRNAKNRKAFKTWVKNKHGDAAESVVEKIFDPSGGDVTSGELEQLVEYSSEFGKEWEAAKRYAEERLTKDMIERMAANPESPFAKYAQGLGIEALQKAWKGYIPQLMAESPRDYEDLKEAITVYEELDKEWNGVIKERAKRAGYSPDKYLKIMKEPNPEKRRGMIKKDLDMKFDGARRFFKGLSSPAKNLAEKGRAELEKALEETNEALEAIGEVFVSIQESLSAAGTDIRSELIRQIRG